MSTTDPKTVDDIIISADLKDKAVARFKELFYDSAYYGALDHAISQSAFELTRDMPLSGLTYFALTKMLREEFEKNKRAWRNGL